ncbi:MAG: hypothetical protein LBP32_03160, partial [Spirochaetaceae bacterium]|nr:hypothetical protein [Spirochaetaceae bacterium]
MIRVLTAHTFEIDDPQAAVGEILEQLDLEQTLRKNSVGLVFCPQDFITSGTMEAVCNALPFDVIGGTSQAVSVPGAMGEFMLAVMVLTGDTFLSAAGSSRPFDGDEESRIRELYGRLSSSLAVPPSMMFLIHPQLTGFAGNQVVDTLDQVSGGRPLFGTVAVGETLKDQSPMIIHNGAAYSDRISLLLISGVENRFCVESIPAMDIRNQPVLVTGASGNRLISINHIPAAEFMEKIGIICNGALNAVSAFPLLIDNHDGMGLKFCAIHSIEND